MELIKLAHDFSVCRIENMDQVDFSAKFVFLSKTDDEFSLVCPPDCVPRNAVAVENGWKALKISGILDFGMVGVIAKIAGLLAAAGISIFVVSTYNTDYVLIKAESFENAVKTLRKNGYTVREKQE
ncbi:MAG: ACT domain-containing protein [Clostridiales bacterium]|jgi:hypothetical protein|nr:ACT domain-containing protein [Clostridiales bacterium]